MLKVFDKVAFGIVVETDFGNYFISIAAGRIIVDEKKYKVERKQIENLRLTEGSFEIILIGKDGGIKFRDNSPVQSSDLYKIIDRMPMRQAEMRSQKR